MKIFIVSLGMVLFTACQFSPRENSKGSDSTGRSAAPTRNTVDAVVEQRAAVDSSAGVNAPGDSNAEEYARYYVVVADTGLGYAALHRKMVSLHQSLRMEIDTLGRHYYAAKDLIALPDNDPDEIYAGDYFPRRFPSENLSLEYLEMYDIHSAEKTIALVTGIYETEKLAERALKLVKEAEKNAFMVKADIYLGCLH